MKRHAARLVCIAIVLSGCSQSFRVAEVANAHLIDGSTVELFVGVCPRDWEESVEGSSDSVVVEIRVRTKTGDCGFSPVISLSEPLGDRVLIDAFDGEPIPLSE